jgi:adenylate cyclase
MPFVYFVPLGVEVECESGSTIFDVAKEKSIPIAESCGGDKICGHCRVKVIEGIESLSAPSEEEEKIMQRYKFDIDERLACAVKVYGNIKITTPYW